MTDVGMCERSAHPVRYAVRAWFGTTFCRVAVVVGTITAVAAPAARATSSPPARAYPRALFALSEGGFPRSASEVADGTIAAFAPLNPFDLSVAADGSLLVAGGHRVVRLDPTGRIVTVAGTGGNANPAAPTPALRVALIEPSSVAVLPGGGFLVGTSYEPAIWMVDTDGGIRAVAGHRRSGDSGNGGPAPLARFDAPDGLLALSDGSLVFTDNVNGRVRRVGRDGIITLLAGSGRDGFGGDHGPAVNAALSDPDGLALLADGSILVADSGNERVRRIDPTGAISTVAGTGEAADRGDGRPAARAALRDPHSVLAMPDGGFIIGGTGLRRVDVHGVITTLAAGRSWDFAGRPVGPILATALLPDGSIAAISPRGVVMLASAAPQRLAVALRDLAVSRAQVQATIDITLASTATLEVRREGAVVARVTRAVGPGSNALVANGRFASRAYSVRVRADDADGRVGGDEVTSYLGDTLTRQAARDAIDNDLPTGDESLHHYVGRCARMGPQRIDCEGRVETFALYPFHRTTDRCVAIDSVRRSPAGILEVAQYRCRRQGGPRFALHPRLRFAPRPFEVASLTYE